MEYNCVSFNVKITGGPGTSAICELNNSTHHANLGDLQTLENSIYHGITVVGIRIKYFCTPRDPSRSKRTWVACVKKPNTLLLILFLESLWWISLSTQLHLSGRIYWQRLQMLVWFWLLWWTLWNWFVHQFQVWLCIFSPAMIGWETSHHIFIQSGCSKSCCDSLARFFPRLARAAPEFSFHYDWLIWLLASIATCRRHLDRSSGLSVNLN